MAAAETAWFADDSFWEQTFPFMFRPTSFDWAVEKAPLIPALSGVASGALLDLACGPGRYAIPFAQAGFAVTAVDRTRFLLERGRERANQAGAHVEWIEADMGQFIRPAAFDLVLNVFTSFGFYDDPADNRRVLENVFTSLRPGGVFVFDHLGKELLAERFMPTLSETLDDGSVMIHRNEIIDDWSRVDGEWILISGERVTRWRIRHWLYSGREIRELLSSVGFVDVRLYGNFAGDPYGPGAARLVAVARRPA
ncbi:MAG TPA: class I SAM-dependent methyltransferase [Pirellulales bacterium]|nr:class I SAM-dependent methyltransferase [Pirellulales bacterium]